MRPREPSPEESSERMDTRCHECGKYHLPRDACRISLPCLECGKMHEVDVDSNEGRGIFNVFCSDRGCEDRYAARL